MSPLPIADASISHAPELKPSTAKTAFRHTLTRQVTLMTQPDREEFTRFCDAIVADYHAEVPIEIQYAQSIAEDFWRLNRARAWETNILALGHFDGTADLIDADHPQIADAFTQVMVVRKQSAIFCRIALYETRINRNIAQNEKRLAARQAARRAAFEQAVLETRLLEAAEPSSEPTPTIAIRGFVFSTPEIHAAIDRQIRLEHARLNQPASFQRTRKAA